MSKFVAITRKLHRKALDVHARALNGLIVKADKAVADARHDHDVACTAEELAWDRYVKVLKSADATRAAVDEELKALPGA